MTEPLVQWYSTCSQYDDNGTCKNPSEISYGYPLDFCAKHNHIVRTTGIRFKCGRCHLYSSGEEIVEEPIRIKQPKEKHPWRVSSITYAKS